MTVLRNTVRRIAFSLGAVALAATFSLTDAASAQFGVGKARQAQTSFTTRDIQVAVDALKLDESQRFIVITLFEDYQTSLDDGKENFNQKIGDMREEIIKKGNEGGNVLAIILGAFSEWQAENEKLSDRFFEDIKRVLNEEQMQLWPSFDRQLFRLKQLKNAKLTGERLDILVVLRELNLSEDQTNELAPLMTSYEIELDKALRKREAFEKSSRSELFGSIENNTPATAISVTQRELALRKYVRDVNERFTESFAAALPEDLRESFIEKVQMRTFARVYRPTRGQRIIKAAKEIKGLAPENLQAIEQLEVDYLVELLIINENLVRLIKAQEPADILYKVKARQARATGVKLNKPKNESNDEFSKRRDLDQRYITKLEDLLTPEQYASLPGIGTGGIAALSGTSQSGELDKKAIDAARQRKIEAMRKNRGGGGFEIKDDSKDGSRDGGS